MIDGIRSQGLTQAQVRDHDARIQRAMMAAGPVTTTTQELAGHMRALHKPTFVLPNGFDATILQASRLAVRRLGRHRMMDLSALATRPARARISVTWAWLPALWAACWPSGRLAPRTVPQARLGPCVDLDEFPELADLESRWNGAIWFPLATAREMARLDAKFGAA